MTDEFERRLRSADPAPAPRQGEPAAAWIRDLVEATMTITDEPTDAQLDRRRGQPARWLAVAAAGTAVIALSGGLHASMQDQAPSSAQAPAQVVQLTLGPALDYAVASCLPFSVETLRGMPVAFSGSVTALEGGNARLTVDRWYRGGPSREVLIQAPDERAAALGGAAPFSQGKRYLVSASGGAVGSCGYSGEWDPQYEAAFRQAFGG
jgi:hypothetical protein